MPPVPRPQLTPGRTAAASALTAATSTSISLFRNTDLGGGGSLNLTAEPSVAAHGSVAFETWNYYAAISNDGGTTFAYLDPRSLPSAYGGFCCDQIAYYEPNNDLYVWVLQYWPDGSGNNAVRVVVFKGAANLLAHRYVNYWDLTPQQLGDPSGVNYDQPKVTSTRNFLYIEATRYGNVTTAGSRSVVLRLPLSSLAAGGYLSYNYYRLSSDTYFVSSPGLVQGTTGTTTAYFAGHIDQGTGGLGTFLYPYVHVVRINEQTKTLIDQPIVWNPNFAFQYAAIVGSGQGALGGVALWGGGSAYEDCAVLIHDSLSASFWDVATPDTSNADPAAMTSGDYLAARANSTYPGVWSASCFSLKNGGYPANVHPYYLAFGRPGVAAP